MPMPNLSPGEKVNALSGVAGFCPFTVRDYLCEPDFSGYLVEPAEDEFSAWVEWDETLGGFVHGYE